MGHRSLKMELIKKESTRKHTFAKRKTSLVKKISEISVLCGVEACLIIYAKDEPVKVDTVWPSDSDQVRKIIDKYKKTNKSRRSYTVSDYFAEKKRKLDSEIFKLHKQINGAKYPCWHIGLDDFSLDELRALNSRLDQKIDAADQKLNLISRDHQKDVMLHLSENFGNYMNRKTNYDLAKKLTNFQVPLPFCLQPGQAWFMNHPQQQLLFSDSNRDKAMDEGRQFEEESMSTQLGGWTISNLPIWQAPNYVNSNLGSNTLQVILPQFQAFPPPEGKFYNDPSLMNLPASWYRNGSNH